MKKAKNISKYVVDFIEQNNMDKKFIEKWNTNDNIANLKKYLNIHGFNSKPRNINKPKRGKTAYLFFCEEFRDDVKKEFPAYNARQIVAVLGERWNDLKKTDPKKISYYEKKSEVERDKYKIDIAAYRQEVNTDVPVPEEKQVKKRKPRQKKETEEVQNLEDIVEKKPEKKTEKKVDTEEVEVVKDKTKSKKEKIEEVHDDEDDGFEKYFKKKVKKTKIAHPDLDDSQILKKLKKKWKAMPDDKKDSYRN